MREGALFWLFGASLAFLATAGALLMLANFGTAPRGSAPIPRTGPAVREVSSPKLALSFSQERLDDLKRRPDQNLTLYVGNRSKDELGRVDVEVAASSEDTANPMTHRYRKTVTGLASGETRAVDVTVDLSPAPPVEGAAALGEKQEGDREILEARARTTGGATVVETAVLSP